MTQRPCVDPQLRGELLGAQPAIIPALNPLLPLRATRPLPFVHVLEIATSSGFVPNGHDRTDTNQLVRQCANAWAHVHDDPPIAVNIEAERRDTVGRVSFLAIRFVRRGLWK